jgi:hypothetical protein
MRILFFDVETAPLHTFIWRPNQGWVPYQMMEKESVMLSFSAKWRGEREIISDIVLPEEARRLDDYRVAAQLGDLMRQADIVIAHNLDKFDLPVVNGRLILQKLEPLPPLQRIDTLKMSHKFGFAYHNLDYLAKAFFSEHKIKTDFELWRRVMRGDEVAARRMLRYNQKDVKLLEKVFERMLPYVHGLPALVNGRGVDAKPYCPFCGSEKLQRRGFSRPGKVNTYIKWQCTRCKKYSSERTHDRLHTHKLKPL